MGKDDLPFIYVTLLLMKMKNHERIYLELLSAVILQQPFRNNLSLDLNDSIWKEVCDLSDKQRTSAMIAESILSLPEHLLPPRAIRMKLIIQQEQIKKRNEKLNVVLAEITNIYNDMECPTILLKGQGVALNSNIPLYRTPGDIDLFFFKEDDYEKANNWVIQQGLPREQESVKHMGFDWQDVHIENHRVMATFERKKYNHIYLEEEKMLIANNKWEKVQFNGCEVLLLPSTFNSCYLFIHLFHHFIHAGVSTRHLSDWIFLLLNNKEKINLTEAERLFDRLALRRPAAIFAGAAVKYLGVPPEIFPIPPDLDSRFVDVVMKDLLRGGHFGRYHGKKKRPSGIWSGRWHSFKLAIHRTLSMFSLSPQHFMLLPIHKVWIRFKLTLKGESNRKKPEL